MVNDVLCAFRGMRGEDIRIEGTTGDYLGKHMCSRAINVNGNGGDFPGASNRGGTIIIGGDAYLPGAEMASGSIVIKGKARVLPSYQYQGRVGFQGMTLNKYLGDLADNGKGNVYAASIDAD